MAGSGRFEDGELDFSRDDGLREDLRNILVHGFSEREGGNGGMTVSLRWVVVVTDDVALGAELEITSKNGTENE